MSRRRRGNRQLSLIDDVDAGELQWLENSINIVLGVAIYVVVTLVFGIFAVPVAVYEAFRKR